jgi:hypothetical protein
MKKIKKENKMKKVITSVCNQLSRGLEEIRFKVESAFQKGLEWLNRKRVVVGQRLSCTRGISTIEIILIIVVLIALIIIFRDRLMTLMNSIFDNITSESGSV